MTAWRIAGGIALWFLPLCAVLLIWARTKQRAEDREEDQRAAELENLNVLTAARLKEVREKSDREAAPVNLWRDRSGQDFIEYSLLAGLVAVASAAILPPFTQSISTLFSAVNSAMEKAAGS